MISPTNAQLKSDVEKFEMGERYYNFIDGNPQNVNYVDIQDTSIDVSNAGKYASVKYIKTINCTVPTKFSGKDGMTV